MALQGNLSEDRNVYRYDFSACYARVVEVRSQYVSSYIDVWYYADADARANDGVCVKTETIALATSSLPPASNPIEQGYLYCKTLPEFAGWVDA